MDDEPRSDQVEEAAPSSEPARSTLAGVGAACAPLLAVAYAFGGLVLLSGGVSSFAELITMAGTFGFLLVLIVPIIGLSLAVLLFFMASRGTRIPVAIAMGLASGPWLLGLGGTLLGMVRVTAAIRHADGGIRSMLAMVGSGEAVAPTAIGAWFSGALLLAIGFGLALGARARRGPKRKIAFALLAVPVLGVVGLVIMHAANVTGLLFLAPAALSATLAMALAASSVGTDEASGRQASAAGLACLLGLIATLLAIVSLAYQGSAGGYGSSDAASRGMFSSMILNALVLGKRGLLLVCVCVGFGSVATAALSFVRARPRGGRLIGAAAAVVVAVVVLGADRLVFASMASDVLQAARPPWGEVTEFEPTRTRAEDPTDPHALVTREQLVPFEGTPVPFSDRGAVLALFGSLRLQSYPRWGSTPDEPEPPEEDMGFPEWLEDRSWGDAPRPDEETAPDLVVRADHQLTLALDARLSPAALRTLIGALVEAEIDSLTLVAQTGPTLDDDVRERLAQVPMLEAVIMGGLGSTSIALEGALPAGYADGDVTLWHAEVGGDALVITPRVHADIGVVQLPAPGRFEVPLARVGFEELPGLSDITRRYAGDPVVYLTLQAGVTPRKLFEAARIVNAMDARPLVVLGELPGHPERAASGAAEEN